ncbi:MAG: leucine--tRNA ligase, partial [Candidatus Bathyarchaeota archaeon]
DNATGIVYSVPAHAPYDWLALKDLQESPEVLKKFNINVEDVKKIKPISIVKVEGFGDFPAVEIVNKMNIKDQNDPKAEEATKIIYKKEFHTGVLKENCGDYAGWPISTVKQQLIEDFRCKGLFDVMYELPGKVVCRCTTSCIVKVLQDQWFLNYSNPEWKKKARELLSKMRIYPEEARKWFEDVIDWLHDWACTRKTGLGSPLPWAKDWIVETLSDSTIYPAFYTINKHIKMHRLKAEQLTESFFDYVFYGLGDVEKVSTETGIPSNILNDVRKEFLYWYPVDLRNSGKDLVPNHLTFYIFHHAALFPPEHWPKIIGVNGFMRVEGEEMHKSKGNFIPLRRALDNVGADITRCTVLLAAEGMDDPNWKNTSLIEVRDNLNALYNFLLEIREIKDTRENEIHMDRWLLTSIYHHVEKVSENIEVLKTRTALETALYEVWRSFRWYFRRVEKPNRETILKATSIWIRLLAPFIPHLAEELWEKFGEKGFILTVKWPKGEVEPSLKDEVLEELIQNLFEDTKDIVKVIKSKPKKIFYYTASGWKWEVYLKVLSKRFEENLEKRMIKALMSSSEVREKGASAAKYVKKIVEDILKMPEDIASKRLKLGFVDEYELLMGAKKFFEKEFNTSVYVFREDDEAKIDPKGKSQVAEPYRPAIFIEE